MKTAKKMKKIVLGIALLVSLFSCSTSDEITAPVTTDAHTFEFNAHTEIPTSSNTAIGPNTNYTLVVEAFTKDGHKIASKTFAANITADFNCKFETFTGNLELKVTVSPATTVVKNISFTPTNQSTNEIGKIMEFTELPTSGSLTAVYDESNR
jgi:hypothetical protein